jgi:hypothetical protein
MGKMFNCGMHRLIRVGVLMGIFLVVGTGLSRIVWPNLLPSPQWQPHSTWWEWIGISFQGLDIFTITMDAVLFPILALTWTRVPDAELRRQLVIDFAWIVVFYMVLALAIWKGPIGAGRWQWRPIP